MGSGSAGSKLNQTGGNQGFGARKGFEIVNDLVETGEVAGIGVVDEGRLALGDKFETMESGS